DCAKPRSVDRGFVVIRMRASSAGDHQVHRLWPFALFVRLDIEANALAFVQTFQPCLLYCRDVNKHVASTIIRFDKAVPPLAVEELHDTRLCHQELLSPSAPPPVPCTAARLDIHNRGKRRPHRPQSLRPPPQEAERHCQRGTEHQLGACGKSPGVQWSSGTGLAVSQSSRKPGVPAPPK